MGSYEIKGIRYYKDGTKEAIIVYTDEELKKKIRMVRELKKSLIVSNDNVEKVELDYDGNILIHVKPRIPDVPPARKIMQLLNEGKKDLIFILKLNYKLAYACLKSGAYADVGYCNNCALNSYCAFITDSLWFYKKFPELRERMKFLTKKVGLKFFISKIM